MTYAALGKLKKNSPEATLTAGIDDTTGTFPVDHLEYFHDDDGTLIVKGIVIGPNTATATETEEVTITGASGTTGAGNLTGGTRGVNADGTNGAAKAWDSGTVIKATYTTGIHNQIRDNFAAHQTIIAAMQNKNILINPGFTVNQRVYVSGTDLGAGSAGNGYAHDRWRAGTAGTNTYTFTQLASPTQVTITAGTIIQTVENKNVEGGDYVLSWTGTAQARVGYGSSVAASLPSGAYAASPIVISNIPAGDYITVEYDTGTLYKPQLESGTVPTKFEFRPYGTESILCQRFFVSISSSNYANFGYGFGYTSTQGFGFVALPTPMRALPTLVSTYQNFSFATPGVGTFPVTSIVVSSAGNTPSFIQLNCGFASGITANQMYILAANNAGSSIQLSAEL
jgi:hypothetical protein